MTTNTQGASWDALYFEVMEDYIMEAEMSHALRNGKDEAYYERMQGHFEKLKAYISKERAEGERLERERIANWLADETVQFPQIAGWEKTMEAFKRASNALRSGSPFSADSTET